MKWRSSVERGRAWRDRGPDVETGEMGEGAAGLLKLAARSRGVYGDVGCEGEAGGLRNRSGIAVDEAGRIGTSGGRRGVSKMVEGDVVVTGDAGLADGLLPSSTSAEDE